METSSSFNAGVAREFAGIDLIALERQARVLRARAVAQAFSTLFRALRGVFSAQPRSARAA